jgi:hypothetical protein
MHYNAYGVLATTRKADGTKKGRQNYFILQKTTLISFRSRWKLITPSLQAGKDTKEKCSTFR